ETKQREVDQKIKQLQARSSDREAQSQNLILTPAQEQELEQSQKALVQVTKDLKQVRKNLRRETDALAFWTKVINIGAMPIVVALSGLILAIVKARRRAPAAHTSNKQMRPPVPPPPGNTVVPSETRELVTS